jgi:hypothetical protein
MVSEKISRKITRLEREIGETLQTIRQLRRERLVLAKLAAKKPQFFDPLEALAAEALRDQILKSWPGANL